MSRPRIAIAGPGPLAQLALIALPGSVEAWAYAAPSPGGHPDQPLPPGVTRVPLEALVTTPDCDAVIIDAPPGTRSALALAALQAGRDVLLAPPVAEDLDTARGLVKAAEAAGRVLMIAEPRLFHPALLAARAARAAWGETRLFEGRLSDHGPRIGALDGFSVGHLMTLRALGANAVERVSADGAAFDTPEALDWTALHLHLAGGARAHLVRSRAHVAATDTISVVGEAGGQSLDLGGASDDPSLSRAALRAFADALLTRSAPVAGGRDWLWAVNVADAGRRALDRGRPVAPTVAARPDHFVHPTAVVDGPVRIGAGTKIWHFSKLLGPLSIGERCSLGQNVVVERNVTIGDNVKIQNNVSVYSGVVLEDDVFCGPSMVFTNIGTPRSHFPRRGQYETTRVKRGASIGANATVVCGTTLGAYSLVGAGAVVTRDVPDFALVYGNPARLRGWACYCGERLPLGTEPGEERATCTSCGRRYTRQGSAVRLAPASTDEDR